MFKKIVKMRFILQCRSSVLALLSTVLILFAASPATVLCVQAANEKNAKTVDTPAKKQEITDIATWKHPTKAVFSKYGVTLTKVTLIDKYPIFSAQFPFDPQTSPNARRLERMCVELLRANGNWSYTLEAPEDGVAFEVKWNSRARTIEITNQSISSR